MADHADPRNNEHSVAYRYVLEQQHLDVVAERDALCEALRIAVEGLHQTLACGCCCYGKEHDDGCHEPLINAALAAVRELVDLGEKP